MIELFAISTTSIAFISLAKDVFLNNHTKEKATKILAIKLQYILENFIMQNADKLSKLQSSIQNSSQDVNKSDIIIPDMNLDTEIIDWKNLNTDLIYLLTKLSFDIPHTKKEINSFISFNHSDNETILFAIKKIKIISIDALKILYYLENAYDLPKLNLTYNTRPVQNIFLS